MKSLGIIVAMVFFLTKRDEVLVCRIPVYRKSPQLRPLDKRVSLLQPLFVSPKGGLVQ